MGLLEHVSTRRFIRSIVCVAAFFATAELSVWSQEKAAPAASDPSIEERFAELEAEVQQLSWLREIEEAEERRGWFPGRPLKVEAEFVDGFAFVSNDEEFELRFHVLNQVDYKSFSPSDQDPAAQDGVYIPRTRVYFEGKLTDPFRYEVSIQRSVEGVFDLLDANPRTQRTVVLNQAVRRHLECDAVPFDHRRHSNHDIFQ